MQLSSLRGTLVVFLIAYLNTDVAAISRDDLETHRLLRAATKRSDLYRRGVRITTRFETELAYVESMLESSRPSTISLTVCQMRTSGMTSLHLLHRSKSARRNLCSTWKSMNTICKMYSVTKIR